MSGRISSSRIEPHVDLKKKLENYCKKVSKSHLNVNFSSIFLVLPTHESKQTALSRGIDTSGTSRSLATSLITNREFPSILRSALTLISRQ